MKIIVCIDDKNGMMFNKRRISKDSAVNLKIRRYSLAHKLIVNKYSSELFSDFFNIEINENPLEVAGPQDFVFVENLPLQPYKDKIDEIFIFKWNRRYPSDQKLDIDLNDFEEIYSYDFIGKSHNKITVILMRKNNE